MSECETAVTVHGDVTYEIVSCISCENEVAKEQSSFVVIGTLEDTEYWSHKSGKEYQISNQRTGYVCEYCYDHPVVSGSSFAKSHSNVNLLWGMMIGAFVSAILTMIVMGLL